MNYETIKVYLFIKVVLYDLTPYLASPNKERYFVFRWILKIINDITVIVFLLMWAYLDINTFCRPSLA